MVKKEKINKEKSSTVDSSITKGPCMCAICWVLWTHIYLIGFMYTLANILIQKKKKKRKTSTHEEGEGERGGMGAEMRVLVGVLHC